MVVTLKVFEMIDQSELVLNKENFLGRGTFGNVYEAKYRKKFGIETPVAVKQIKCLNHDNLRKYLSEMKKLTLANGCINIVKFLGISQIKRELWIITEFAEEGSLDQLLHGKKYCHYELKHALLWAFYGIHGINYLHQKKLVHGNIKPQNMLMFQNGTSLKICDFGTVADTKQIIIDEKSIAYMAPEIFKGSKYTEKCDIYSWAITFGEIIARRKPYSDLYNDQHAIVYKVGQGVRPSLENAYIENCPKTIVDFLQKYWHEQPQERSNAREICLTLQEFFWSNLTSSIESSVNMPLNITFLGHFNSDRKNLKDENASGKELLKSKIDTHLFPYMSSFVKDDCMSTLKRILKLNHKHIQINAVLHKDFRQVQLTTAKFDNHTSSLKTLLLDSTFDYDLKLALSWASQCIDGLNYLHSEGFVHGCLSSDSLIMQNNGKNLKVYCELSSDSQYAFCYSDNEKLKISSKKSKESDIYRWAVIIWEILTRRAMKDKDNVTPTINQEINELKFEKYVPQYDYYIKCPSSLNALLKRCWQEDLNQRPDTKEILDNINNLIENTSQRPENIEIHNNKDYRLNKWQMSIYDMHDATRLSLIIGNYIYYCINALKQIKSEELNLISKWFLEEQRTINIWRAPSETGNYIVPLEPHWKVLQEFIKMICNNNENMHNKIFYIYKYQSIMMILSRMIYSNNLLELDLWSIGTNKKTVKQKSKRKRTSSDSSMESDIFSEEISIKNGKKLHIPNTNFTDKQISTEHALVSTSNIIFK